MMNNEITRIRTTTPSISTRSRGIDQAVLTALRSEIGSKAEAVALGMYSVLCIGFSKDEAEQAARRIQYRRVLAMADPIIAKPEYKALVAAIRPALELASLAQIKREVAGLIACYPTQSDVSIFVAFVVEEIAIEQPCVFALAAACRELRRTKTFRPSIAEILEVLQARREGTTWAIKQLLEMDDRISKMRMIVSEGDPNEDERCLYQPKVAR
jgi:hypothetical protein